MNPVRVEEGSEAASQPSLWRALGYLIWLSSWRLARVGVMVWIALLLLALSVFFVFINTSLDRWNLNRMRTPRRWGFDNNQWTALLVSTTSRATLPGGPPAAAGTEAVLMAFQAVVTESGFLVFSRVVAFNLLLNFLLPLWTLSFATEGIGGEREENTMVWLLTRPLPRPAIYLAKFVALLPWTMGLSLGGFALLCAAAGRPGWTAFSLYWPSVLGGGLAFSALFYLMGACFRRPAVVAIVYAFFLETILGNMPGYLKRVSINFYTRCTMFDAAQHLGVEPEKPSVYMPVDGTTAWIVLLATTAALLVIGMVVFARSQYQDVT